MALSLTLIAAAAVWAGMIVPLQDWYDDRAELLRRQQAVARRMNALVETLPALRREAAAGGSDSDNAFPLLAGDTDALAAASLQQQIDDYARKAGVRVGSEEILPAQPEGTLRAVAVRVTISAPYRALVAWLLALARSATPMVADELQLRGPVSLQLGNQAGDLPLEATLTVTSWRATKADAR